MITLDQVATFPRPGLSIPGKIAYSPDGKTLTYLFAEDGGLSRVLWTMDVATGKKSVLYAPATGATDANVSREEALRRERQRLRETGVTQYAWSETGETLIVPIRGEVFVKTAAGFRSITKGAIDPHLSRDGTRVAFVRDGELHVVDIGTGAERKLTSGAAPNLTHGLAEYAAQEEMGRFTGFWWSRDGAWIAFEEADDRHIPEYPIPHLDKDAFEIEVHRYPFAGKANAKVRVGIVPSAGGATTWLDFTGFEYLARAAWHPDGRLFVQLQTRDQRRLELRAYDPKTGEGRTILVEESKYWINLHHDLRFIPKTGEFLWASERTGFKHLYLYSADGRSHRAVTSGDWPVDGVIAVEPEGRRVAFTGSRNPVEKHVFVASLDGGEPRQMTTEPGMHEGIFAPDFSSWVEYHDSRAKPYSIRLHSPDREIHAAAAIDLPSPDLFSFKNRTGVTLHGLLYKPDAMPAPLIVAVYGGPHSQTVQDSWTATVDLRCRYLAQQGFAVIKVDNRGMARRGLDFESAVAERLGSIEVLDQVDGVMFARSQGWATKKPAGVIGWSYGGYMALMCLLKAPDVFGAGVSGAPVTHWDGYDTHYTERYMRTPKTNPEGYRDGSAMAHADKLAGKLLLIHGMLDENVHVRHTTRFIDALVKANRPYDLLLYPGERHMPRSEKDRRNMEERIVGFFEGALR